MREQVRTDLGAGEKHVGGGQETAQGCKLESVSAAGAVASHQLHCSVPEVRLCPPSALLLRN